MAEESQAPAAEAPAEASKPPARRQRSGSKPPARKAPKSTPSGGAQQTGQYAFTDVVVPEDDPNFDAHRKALKELMAAKTAAAAPAARLRRAQADVEKAFSRIDHKGQRLVYGDVAVEFQPKERQVTERKAGTTESIGLAVSSIS